MQVILVLLLLSSTTLSMAINTKIDGKGRGGVSVGDGVVYYVGMAERMNMPVDFKNGIGFAYLNMSDTPWPSVQVTKYVKTFSSWVSRVTGAYDNQSKTYYYISSSVAGQFDVYSYNFSNSKYNLFTVTGASPKMYSVPSVYQIDSEASMLYMIEGSISILSSINLQTNQYTILTNITAPLNYSLVSSAWDSVNKVLYALPVDSSSHVAPYILSVNINGTTRQTPIVYGQYSCPKYMQFLLFANSSLLGVSRLGSYFGAYSILNVDLTTGNCTYLYSTKSKTPNEPATSATYDNVTNSIAIFDAWSGGVVIDMNSHSDKYIAVLGIGDSSWFTSAFPY